MARFYRELPEAVKDVLLISEGWLIGGAIGSIIKGSKPIDYDIIVPAENWPKVYRYIRMWTKEFNSFGGVKVRGINNISIDIWIEDLDHFIKVANKFEYAYNFKKNILIKKEE